jgi:hypothetical protein
MLNWRPSLALDTLAIIGRDTEQKAIQDAVAGLLSKPDGQPLSVAIIWGDGGVGKTRLLRSVIDDTRNSGFATSGIVDLYHADTHSSLGIEQAILRGRVLANPNSLIPSTGIDPQNEYFVEYWDQRNQLERAASEDTEPSQLEKLRKQLTDKFVECFNHWTATTPGLLVFDTVEYVQFGRSLIESICEIRHGAFEVKEWLTETLPRLRDTLVILAGRGPQQTNEQATIHPSDSPRENLWRELLQVFQPHLIQSPFNLSGLTPTETVTYFQAVATAAEAQCQRIRARAEITRSRGGLSEADELDAQANELDEAVQRIADISNDEVTCHQLCTFTEGRPIRLGLVLDLLGFGIAMDEIFHPSNTWLGLETAILERLSSVNIGFPVADTLRYLSVTRQGLDSELLHYLDSTLDEAKCQERLEAMQSFSFVKVRPTTRMVFLHDEMYNLLDELRVAYDLDPGYRELYRKIIAYFAHRLRQAGLLANEREAYQLALVHYHMRLDPGEGYQIFYRLVEEAMIGQRIELELKLIDEVTRFYQHPQYRERAINARVPPDLLERHNAVRLVLHFLRKNDNEQASRVAETVLALGPSVYQQLVADQGQILATIPQAELAQARRVFATDDPYFWSSLLTVYGEAQLYLAQYAQAERVITLAIRLLHAEELAHE